MIKSSRNVYVASHVTRGVKEALKVAAHASGVSQSEFVSQAIAEKLERQGIKITEPVKQREKLPFEGTNADERTTAAHSDH